MEGRGVVVRERSPQINGFGGGAFMGDEKILSVIVAKRRLMQHRGRASGAEVKKVGQKPPPRNFGH